MNPLFWPVLAIAVFLFWLGQRLYRTAKPPAARAAAWTVAIVAALPGLLFAVYYVKLLGEPIWLYRFRALPGSELVAAGLGLLAGMAQSGRHDWPSIRKYSSRLGIPVFFGFILCAPHLKPLLRPLQLPDSPNGWFDGVCKQSTPSTCGPASAATLARLAGMDVEEYTLAQEAFTSASGTENWYLARALRRHGLTVNFMRLDPTIDSLPYPAIAGVKLSFGTGHFIPILGMSGTNLVIGDPLTGREIKSPDELRDEYHFTGFFMIVK